MKSVWVSVACGTLGGLASAWAMHRFRILWERRKSATAENGIFGFDRETDIASVDQLCYLLSLPPVPENEALKAAMVMHYGYGALAGGAYGLVRHHFPGARAGFGFLFGTSLWLLGDEIAVSAAGLSKPFLKDRSAHMSAYFAHLLFGGITEAFCRAFGRRTEA